MRGQLELKNSTSDSLNKQAETLEIENLKNILKSKEEKITCIENQIKEEQEKNEQNMHLIDSYKAQLKSIHINSSTLSKENKQLKEAANELENKLKDKMESLDILDNQLEDSNLKGKHICNGQEMTVKTAQISDNNEQNREEIVQHEDHNDSGNYDYDDFDHYEEYEDYEGYDEYNDYDDYNKEYNEYSPHSDFEEYNKNSPHDDFVEKDGFNGNDENEYDAENFYENEAELDGGALDDGIVINSMKHLLELGKKGSIDIYKVIVTTKKGEKKKCKEVIMSLNEDQKALVKVCIADTGINIFEALFCNDITEFDDLLSLIEHDSSIKYL